MRQRVPPSSVAGDRVPPTVPDTRTEPQASCSRSAMTVPPLTHTMSWALARFLLTSRCFPPGSNDQVLPSSKITRPPAVACSKQKLDRLSTISIISANSGSS
ncbi:hypothetical protein SeMB42_g02465 [Synchytrium endobioticum]|uniref:Uncharacterized protein n=1 Tax=Synchytrium endobioticum TaxID=286115 RepID=A0A507DG61_9FUNG|nr:hypothetical protein SeMB42_g02465 [Synchytrium endobioticum]